MSRKNIDLLSKNLGAIEHCDSMIDVSVRSIAHVIDGLCSTAEYIDGSVLEIDEYQRSLAGTRDELLKRRERSRRIADNFRKLLEIDEHESTEEQA